MAAAPCPGRRGPRRTRVKNRLLVPGLLPWPPGEAGG